MGEVNSQALDAQSQKFLLQLNNEWSKSLGQEQASDSHLLKEFKRYKLPVPVSDDRRTIYVPSVNEFAPYLKRYYAGETVSIPNKEWVEAALIAHNNAKPDQPIAAEDVGTSEDAKWREVTLIQDTLYYAVLLTFCNQKAQDALSV